MDQPASVPRTIQTPSQSDLADIKDALDRQKKNKQPEILSQTDLLHPKLQTNLLYFGLGLVATVLILAVAATIFIPYYARETYIIPALITSVTLVILILFCEIYSQ